MKHKLLAVAVPIMLVAGGRLF